MTSFTELISISVISKFANSACVGWGNSPTWCVDSLLHKQYYADVTVDAPSLPMHFDGSTTK